MRIAAVPAAPVVLDRSATTDKLLDLMHEAASKGAELILFPEVFLSGYPTQTSNRQTSIRQMVCAVTAIGGADLRV